MSSDTKQKIFRANLNSPGRFFVPDYILEYTYRFYRYFFDSRLPDGFSHPTQSR